jgi:hypothetical protein
MIAESLGWKCIPADLGQVFATSNAGIVAALLVF